MMTPRKTVPDLTMEGTLCKISENLNDVDSRRKDQLGA